MIEPALRGSGVAEINWKVAQMRVATSCGNCSNEVLGKNDTFVVAAKVLTHFLTTASAVDQ